MKGTFHTGITVKNLDVTVPFYQDILGLKLKTPPTDWYSGEEFSAALGLLGKDAQLRLAIFQLDDGKELEVLEYRNPVSTVKRPMPPNTLGAMHFAFEVDDIFAEMNKLKSKGVEFLSEPNVVTEGPLNGWKWVYFRDPDGITLEMIQYNDPNTK